VKKAGDLFSAILDEKALGKAREHSRLFSVWKQLNNKHGIAAAANHSRIQDIRHSILIVEADHPGWIQILQTRESELLSDLQKSFPRLGICGIAFRLAKMPVEADSPDESEENESMGKNTNDSDEPKDKTREEKPGYEKIKDKELLEKLKSLEKNIGHR
jgi:hypothetical protein